ncbi:MAG: PA2779 family protein [Mariprofundaceae bacterium]|nr:PA2779 family protein [Mariprofundaceae bacterium]
MPSRMDFDMPVALAEKGEDLMVEIFRKICSLLMVASILMISFPIAPVYAAMVGTGQIVKAQSADEDRERIIGLFERSEVQQQLQTLGVSADEVQLRVANMTDAEVHMLAGEIDQLPAGGDVVTALISAALIVFLVLLFTDIIGVTDVFSFVNR